MVDTMALLRAFIRTARMARNTSRLAAGLLGRRRGPPRRARRPARPRAGRRRTRRVRPGLRTAGRHARGRRVGGPRPPHASARRVRPLPPRVAGRLVRGGPSESGRTPHHGSAGDGPLLGVTGPRRTAARAEPADHGGRRGRTARPGALAHRPRPGTGHERRAHRVRTAVGRGGPPFPAPLRLPCGRPPVPLGRLLRAVGEHTAHRPLLPPRVLRLRRAGRTGRPARLARPGAAGAGSLRLSDRRLRSAGAPRPPGRGGRPGHRPVGHVRAAWTPGPRRSATS